LERPGIERLVAVVEPVAFEAVGHGFKRFSARLGQGAICIFCIDI
jgi:predicted phosphoribosyltransferase